MALPGLSGACYKFIHNSYLHYLCVLGILPVQNKSCVNMCLYEYFIFQEEGNGMGDATSSRLSTTLAVYQTIEQELSLGFLEREELIHAIMLTVLARQHAAIIGPPGTGKSALINDFCARLTGPQGGPQGGAAFFVYLMTKQTNEEEIFGPPDVAAFRTGKYQRVLDRRLATAHIAFLDELFSAPC